MSAFGRLRRMARRHPHVVDVGVAMALFAVTLVTTATGPPQLRGHLTVFSGLAAGVAYGALPFRRRWPWAVLVIAAAGAEFYMAISQADVGVFAAPVIALYSLADTGSTRSKTLKIGGLIVLAMAGIHAVMRPSGWIGPENLALVSLGGLAVAAGDASRSHRAYTAEVEVRARRAEREQEQEARRRVTEERLRIARDLHDVIGHRIALIKVQVGVAEHVFDTQRDHAREALAHIKHESGAALEDLRDTVGLLRQPGEPVAPVEPVAGLAGITDLVDTFTRSGLKVRQRTEGTVRPVPPSADLTAYRVVQEALTNVSKHARDASATVMVSYGPSALLVVVDDDGGGGAALAAWSDGLGHGLTGMRERVTAVGGYLDAKPKPGRGFQVRAMLPLPTVSVPVPVPVSADGGST